MWGLTPPEGVETYWGARTINHGTTLDFVPDRMQAEGPAKAELLAALNERSEATPKALAAITATMDEDERRVLFADDTITVEGRKAGGYVYLGAWFTPTKES